MPFHDEDLIAFLLGDADRELRAQIEQALKTDSVIRERVEELRTVLGHLDSFRQDVLPPDNLVDSTMARIESETSRSAPTPDSPQPASTQAASTGLLSPTRLGGKRSATFLDTPALALCIGAICCMILPAVLQVRYQARKLQCADNLQENGKLLVDYASNSPVRRYPSIPASGPHAFAGYYVVQLKEAGTPVASSTLHCPSLIGSPGYGITPPPSVIDSGSLSMLRPQELEAVQRVIGGNFAYSLGIMHSGTISAPKLRGSSQVAILADSPIVTPAGEQFVAHSGKGMNMLFDDGRVVFISAHSLDSSSQWPGTIDYPFRNHLGIPEAGLSDRDNSLAPSHFPPRRNF